MSGALILYLKISSYVYFPMIMDRKCVMSPHNNHITSYCMRNRMWVELHLMSPSSPSNLILWPIESQLCFFYTLFHYTLTNIWQDVSAVLHFLFFLPDSIIMSHIKQNVSGVAQLLSKQYLISWVRGWVLLLSWIGWSQAQLIPWLTASKCTAPFTPNCHLIAWPTECE